MKTPLILLAAIICSTFGNAQVNNCLDLGGNQNLATNTTDDDYLTVPDANELDITSAITIEAWIYRSGTNATEQTIIDKSTSDAACNYRFSVQNNRLAFWRTSATGPEYSNATIPANAWVHVAFTISGGTLRFYINGVLDATIVSGNTTLGSANSGLLYIGNCSIATGISDTRYFHGRIDELRIWSSARTEAEIKTNMFNRNLSNSAANLSGYWIFNDGSGSTVTNQCTTTGSALNATFVNSPAWTASPVQFKGNALHFNGSSNYMQLNNRINLGTSDFTIEAWIYPSTTSAAMIFAQDVCGDAEQQFRLFTQNNVVRFDMSDAASLGAPYSFSLPSTSNSTPLNTWTHVAAVRSSNTYYVYINGVLNATTNTGANTINNQSGADVNKRLRIGSRGGVSGGCGLNYFNGRLDEIRFWTVARTAIEIQQNWSLEIDPNTNPNLFAYYTFNQGIASGTNTGLTTLTDQKGSNNGTLTNFTMSGGSSNFLSQTTALWLLPVNWASFTAQKQKSSVLLKWSVESESNVSKYLVQHSTNGSNWQEVGSVTSLSNSSNLQHYAFTHDSPENGLNYYRVIQSDYDGKTGYSEVRRVEISTVARPFKVISNPINNSTLKIQVMGLTNQGISMVSRDGKLVWRKQFSSGIHSIEVDKLPAGIYLLRSQGWVEKVLVR